MSSLSLSKETTAKTVRRTAGRSQGRRSIATQIKPASSSSLVDGLGTVGTVVVGKKLVFLEVALEVCFAAAKNGFGKIGLLVGPFF